MLIKIFFSVFLANYCLNFHQTNIYFMNVLKLSWIDILLVFVLYTHIVANNDYCSENELCNKFESSALD